MDLAGAVHGGGRRRTVARQDAQAWQAPAAAQHRSAGSRFGLGAINARDKANRRLNESVYGFKTLVDPGTGRILGAHLVGPHVDEVINLFGLAIRHEFTADGLKSTMFAYPTGASDIGYMV